MRTPYAAPGPGVESKTKEKLGEMFVEGSGVSGERERKNGVKREGGGPWSEAQERSGAERGREKERSTGGERKQPRGKGKDRKTDSEGKKMGAGNGLRRLFQKQPGTK